MGSPRMGKDVFGPSAAMRYGGLVSQGIAAELIAADPIRRSKGAAEGARAFAEKRPPVWLGE